MKKKAKDLIVSGSILLLIAIIIGTFTMLTNDKIVTNKEINQLEIGMSEKSVELALDFKKPLEVKKYKTEFMTIEIDMTSKSYKTNKGVVILIFEDGKLSIINNIK